MLRLGLPAELDAGERTLLPLLIPPRDPLVRADGVRHLPHALAGIFVAARALEAHDPLVVSVPASRVGGRGKRRRRR